MKKVIPDGRRIRAARNALGLNIETLAQGVCSPSYLSLIENGKRPVTAKIWAGLEAVIGEQLNQDLMVSQERVFDELTASVRLLSPTKVHLIPPFALHLAAVFDRAITLEAEGALFAASAEYRYLFSLATSDMNHWAEICGYSDWGFRMFIFVSEQLSRLEADSNKLEAAASVAETALQMAADEGIQQLDEVRTLRGLLIGIYSELGDFDASDRMLDQMDETSLTSRDQALSLWLRGQLLLDRGKLIESAFVLRSASDLLRGNALVSTQFRLTNAAIWSECLADTQLSMSALEEIGAAVFFFREQKNLTDLASCLNTRAFLAARLGMVELARESNAEALELCETASGPRKARLLSGIAMCCTLTGEDDVALGLLRDARKLLDNGDYGRRSATIWAQMSNIYEALGDTAASLACLKASLNSLGVSSSPLSIGHTNEAILPL